MNVSSKLLSKLKPFLWLTIASAIYAVGFNWCYKPNAIAFGGLTGIAQVVNHYLPWAPIGTVVILFNVPLFLLGWRLLGGHLLVSSLYAMATSSIFIDLLDQLYTFPPMEQPLLACIFGGVLLGLSLGIVFLQGATTGGTDLIARLMKLKMAWLPMGRLVMLIDLVSVLTAAIAFRSLNSALYGLLSIYITGLMMDQVLYGLDNAKVAYIISDSYEAIASSIVTNLDRGVTILHGEGAYSGASKRVLMCAFKQRQIVAIKQVVKELDPAAFIIVCNAHEVLGDGFREYKQNDL